MMTLDELMAVAFREGCGISLEYARRTPRYQALLANARELELPEPEASALTEFLGERLADRAFHNLPSHVRAQVGRWHEGVEVQREILGHICNTLRSATWRRAGEREAYQYNSDPRSVLPHRAQSWTRGKIMPNCLAVEQMMLGFARATGAPHYMANVVRSFEHEMLAWEVRCLRDMLNLLKREPSSNRHIQFTMATLDRAYEAALLNATNRHAAEAHHVLVLQLGDGSWWVVDPYLDALYCLDEDAKRDSMLLQLSQLRHRTLMMQHPLDTPSYAYKLVLKLEALNFLLMLIKGRFDVQPEAGGTKDVILVGLARVVAYMDTEDFTEYDQGFIDTLIKVAEAPQATFDGSDPFSERVAVALMTGLDPDLDEAKIAPRLRRAKHDQVLQQRIAWRIVSYYLECFVETINKVYSDRADREHRCLEVAWPGLMLGVATLNHLRAHMPVRLGGLLAVLSTSQWVLADTLAAERNGDSIDDSYRSMLATRLSAFGDLPAEALVPPLQWIKYDDTEENHG